jgi:hypothetical protein
MKGGESADRIAAMMMSSDRLMVSRRFSNLFSNGETSECDSSTARLNRVKAMYLKRGYSMRVTSRMTSTVRRSKTITSAKTTREPDKSYFK